MKYISKVGVIALLLGAIFTIAAVLAEPWNTLLFLLVIPLAVQLVKLYKDKTGNTLGKPWNQLISLVLTMIFTFIAGGFAGIGIPDLPVWGGDAILFISDLFTFIGELSVLIGAAWGSMMVLYEVIWDKLFVAMNLGTEDKY